ncbi:MAG TPA: 4-hydroxy-3-methylbut-2-enyl diphosphate reductase [Candidatus Aminicenantes bacterium]|nr:4-hydroxy-3-methylbut-2-enyl diphosphate reductase [Candidatus Aminicenantes bacterium]HRY65666.1 4-hydroxy-3-methylbut-2-enyl diphosphate reductase [Candidatus Aminicenantes bacterium]HRZ72446.1 4-hydroxy-3-methylbut-2-enyl diphosphate reductase [Candidatus Aminicenantes bacterium]
MKIVLSETLSYCVGVRRTLERTRRLLADRRGRTCFMLGEIVHNERVIEDLKARGLRIVRDLDEVPPDGVVILQSHGSTRRRYEELAARGLEFVDATCPMVRIIHDRIREVEAEGRLPVVIGQAGHEEVRGIVGQVARAVVVKSPEDVTPGLFAGVSRAGVVAQSTFVEEDARLIVERLRALVPDVVYHDTICRPTKTRQRDVARQTRRADCVIIIGSRRSANTMHLFDIARAINPATHLIDRPEMVDGIKIPEEATVFVASGASTPMDLVTEVVRRLETRGGGRPAPQDGPR